MAEEARQTDATLITPIPSDEVKPEPDPTVASSTDLIRTAFVTDGEEPSTSMGDSFDFTSPEGGTSFSQQPTTLQELNIGNLRKQLISQCDFNVADIESWKSMGLSVKDLKHLELDDLLKNPVLTPSYQVTKFRWLQTQLEASALDKIGSLSSHNSMVDTVTITNKNYLKISEDSDKSFVAEDTEMSAVKLEEMLGNFELSNVHNIEQCLTQFNLAERPESESSVTAMSPVSSHVSIVDTSPEKCAILNSNPASILNHLSTDLSEEMSDNCGTSLFNDDVFKPDSPVMDQSSLVDPLLLGDKTVLKSHHHTESSRRKIHHESSKPKTAGGNSKRDNKHQVKRHEDVSSVSHAHDKANDKKTPRSEQTLERNATERKASDHAGLKIPLANAKDRKDCTRKEIVHSNKNEESVVKSVIISFSQEKVKVITDLVGDEVLQPTKDIVQVTTGLETKELEEEKEWSEHRPINLNVDPLVSRKLDATLVSFRDDGVDHARTPVDPKPNCDDEEECSATKIRDILSLEERVISSEKTKNADGVEEMKSDVGCYSSEKVKNSDQDQNGGVDLSEENQDFLIENDINTPQKNKVENEDDLTEMNCLDNLNNYKRFNKSVTDSVTGTEFRDSFTCTDEGVENAGKDFNEKNVINYSEDNVDIYEEKMEGFTNTATKVKLNKITDQKESFEQKHNETNSPSGIVQNSVNCQTENTPPLIYLDHDNNAQLNMQVSNDLKNGDDILSPNFTSGDPDECVVNLSPDTIKREDGDDHKVANGSADTNRRDVTEEVRKIRGVSSDSGSMVVFEENAKQMPRPIEDIDGRVVVVKMAVTTRQTSGGVSGKCQLQTLGENSELEVSKSPKPYHVATSTSSIFTVNNDSQPSGSIRITCKVKEDFPDVEQSISSQEEVDVITSKLSRVNYHGSDVIDDGIPGHLETAESADILKTTSSINITECSPLPINSILPYLAQSDIRDKVNIVDVTDEIVTKTEPISDLESTTAVENNLHSVMIEKQTEDTICLNKSLDGTNLMFACPQKMTDSPEMVERNNILIRDDLKAEPHERSLETKHEDSTFVSKKDKPPFPARKEPENKCQAIKRNDSDIEQRTACGTTPDAVTVEKVTGSDTRINVPASSVRTPDVVTRGAEEVRNCQKRQAQNVEPVTASVTSKVEITTTSRVIRQPQDDRPVGTSDDAKGTGNLALRDEARKELWESSNGSGVRICRFSQSQKPSTVFKQILRTESSQIFRTGDDRKIFSKSVEFSNSSQKELTRFKVTKNIYQVQQRKSSYGQMKVIEKGLKNFPAKKSYNRDASFEKDARIANRVQQMTFIQDVRRNTSQRRQIDVIQNGKKTTKSTIKNVNFLEPIKSNKNKELSEKNSNPKNNFKKSVSLNLKSEKTVVVPTEALESQSSGDTIYQDRILPDNFYESVKTDGKGDPCHKFPGDDTFHHCPKKGATDDQRHSKSAKQSPYKSIAMNKNKNKGHLSAPAGRRKKLKTPKYIQAGSLESCQGTLSSVRISSMEMSPRCTSRSSLASQSFWSAPNSPDSPPPKEEKNSQRIHSFSTQEKSPPRKTHVPSCPRFQTQYESPVFNVALTGPEQRRNRCPVTAEKTTTTEDNLPDRSDSSSSLADVGYPPFYFENQPTYSSSDISVFPISCTDMHEETGRMYSNLNDCKTNRNYLNQGQLLQTLCRRLGDNGSPGDSGLKPKNQKAIYLTESMFNNMGRKKRQDPYEHSAPLPPPPSPPSPPSHSKCYFPPSYDMDDESDCVPIPKTFGKEHQNFKNIRELKALEKSLKRETTRIQKPPQIKFQPYIFTSLEPYYDTSLVRYMMEHPHGSYPGYRSRQTALDLCDPVEDLKLDTYILPKVSVKAMKKIQDNYKKIKKNERRSPPKSSGTRSSTFPVVNLEGQKLTKRQLTFSDVPMLRKELQEKCTMNSQKKILQDYERTKEDFYRLELDRLNEIHPINRANVRASYFAYLQNTPGSRKAIYDCIQKK